jgi:hypothetical protein
MSLISGTENVTLADVHEPVLVTVDERLEQHSSHERENGRVRSDAERQREDHNGRQPFAAHQRLERNS